MRSATQAEEAVFCPISTHENLFVSFFPGLRRRALVWLRRRAGAPDRLRLNQPSARRLHQCRRAPQPADEEEEPGDVLPSGKGNAESLAHFAAGEKPRGQSGRHVQAMEEFYSSVMADPGNEKTAGMSPSGFSTSTIQKGPSPSCPKSPAVPTFPRPSSACWPGRICRPARPMPRWPPASRPLPGGPIPCKATRANWKILVQTGKLAEAAKTLDQAAKHIRHTPANFIALANLYAACRAPQEKKNDPVAPPRRRPARPRRRLKFPPRASGSEWPTLTRSWTNRKKQPTSTTRLAHAKPATPPPLRNLLREKLGVILLDMHDTTNAAVQFQAIVKDDPVRFLQAWYCLGIIAHSEGLLAPKPSQISKEPSIRAAVSNWPTTVWPSSWPSQLRGDDALQFLDRAAPHFPDSFDAQFYNALVNIQLKDFDEAVRQLTAAETLARTNNHRPA